MPAKKNKSKYRSVERILSSRTQKGELSYLVKWKRRSSKFNSWEKLEHLSQRIIEQYEQQRKNEQCVFDKEPPKKETAVAINLQPDKILGLYERNGQLLFSIKWKNSDKKDYVSVSEAKIKYPQVVIEFYEKKIVWVEDSKQ